tara:strand:- start:19372 stop:20181 length:810 start_codon:yes stop_codon:yes gene_type:complete
MPSLTTEHDFKRINPGACYLCGDLIRDRRSKTREHVVPRQLFRKEDRGILLILPAHAHCNGAVSEDDELVGQLAGLLTAEQDGPHPRVHKLKQHAAGVVEGPSGSQTGLLEWLPLPRMIHRWVLGFHAALYLETTGALRRFESSGPMYGSETASGPAPPPHWHRKVAESIKRNLLTNTLDRIEIGRGSCRYWCTWTRLPPTHNAPGRPACFFALDLYGWSRLGAINGLLPLSCVGKYEAARMPDLASIETSLVAPVMNASPYDAFECQR